MTRLTLMLTMALGIAAPAAAQTPLHENQTVRDGFYIIGFADEIRKNCPAISPRLVRAFTYLKSLEDYALKAGYTRDDIKTLQDNKDAKRALQAQINADLAARGAVPGSASGYCTVGTEEIARGTEIGKLLQAN